MRVQKGRTNAEAMSGGGSRLSEVGEAGGAEPIDILMVEEVLERLAGFDQRKAELWTRWCSAV